MAHTAEIDPKDAWSGGHSPFRISYGKMMMWFFLVSDALTFGGLLISYGFIRHKYAEVWPKAEHVFTHFPFVHSHVPLAYVGLMTFILIMSSVTMVLAVEAGHRMDRRGVTVWMFWTIIGGAAFVGSQAWEWFHFIEGTEQGALRHVWDPATGAYVKQIIHGANMTVNEYGVPQFANYFFFITGFHGTHVFSGVMLNLIIFLNVLKGTYEKRGHYEMVEKVGLYWHFVDLVWVFVFTFFYLFISGLKKIKYLLQQKIKIMSEFHDDYPQYEIMSNHGEEEGKKNRRTLWNVFWVMLIITIFELVIGSMAPGHGWSGTLWLKVLFIGLTLAKAAAIVLWFMHLGHEVKFFKYVILTPYIVFMFYTIFIILTEGTYSGSSGHFTKVDPIFMEQQEALKHQHHEPEGTAPHDAAGAVEEHGGAHH